MNSIRKLALEHYQLAYEFFDGKGPCVIFCPGFNSTMEGNKCMELRALCLQQGMPFVRFDYSGHGQSGGDFADGCISTWLSDTLAIIDNVATQEVVIVGSSMGGWLALLAALQRQRRVVGLLLIACAADMTNYYPKRLKGLPLEFDSQQRAYYSVANEYDDQQPYSIYQHLMDDGLSHCLLGQAIALDIPIRLIHGINDEVVEWQRSVQVMNYLRSQEVSLTTIKSGDHRLSTRENLNSIRHLLLDLLAVVT